MKQINMLESRSARYFSVNLGAVHQRDARDIYLYSG